MNKTDHIKTIMRPTLEPMLLRALILLLERGHVDHVIKTLKKQLDEEELAEVKGSMKWKNIK
jgi:hypothetical protein